MSQKATCFYQNNYFHYIQTKRPVDKMRGIKVIAHVNDIIYPTTSVVSSVSWLECNRICALKQIKPEMVKAPFYA